LVDAGKKGSGTRIAIKRRFAEHGITPRPHLELGSNEAIKQAILAGLGICRWWRGRFLIICWGGGCGTGKGGQEEIVNWSEGA